MANREMERNTTRAYTTEEGVAVKEEHLKFPLRKELSDQSLDAKNICEFDLVTFEKPGNTPVYWVRESQENQCEDKYLQRCAHATAFGEMNANRLTPEELTVFIERKNGSVNNIPFYTPPLGEGKCNHDSEVGASRTEIDEACKKNFDCKENLASQHAHVQDLSKEEFFDKPQKSGRLSGEEMLRKLRELDGGAAPKTAPPTPKPTPSIEETTKQEPSKQEPSKQEPVKQEPSKQEPVKQEPVKQEPAKKEPVKQEPAKKEPSKEQAPEQEQNKDQSKKK